MNALFYTDLEKFYVDSLFEHFKNSSFLVTGATGMIGSALVDYLEMLNKKGANIKIYCLVRSKEKAQKRFSDYNDIEYVVQDVTRPFTLKEKVDYIVHAASNASPKLYSTQPVETITGNFFGMYNVLEYAKNNDIKRVLYVSSGEMYGVAQDGMTSFYEGYVGPVDYSISRSCYPAGKRSSEVLCQSYIDEYNLDCVIVRPCHVYGPTMTNADTRAISSFIRNGVNHENIVMKSKGEQVRSHCYVFDAVSAMLTVLSKGKNGEAYNISGDQSVYSIKEMATMICEKANSQLVFDLPTETEQKGFSKVPLAVLDNTKLKELGWHCLYSLKQGIEVRIDILEQ